MTLGLTLTLSFECGGSLGFQIDFDHVLLPDRAFGKGNITDQGSYFVGEMLQWDFIWLWMRVGRGIRINESDQRDTSNQKGTKQRQNRSMESVGLKDWQRFRRTGPVSRENGEKGRKKSG